jgi:hypothetical protein
VKTGFFVPLSSQTDDFQNYEFLPSSRNH